MVNRRATVLALALPPYIWLGLFLIVPLIFMFALSFRADMQGELFSFWTPTLKQYQTILAIDSYWQRLGFSIAVAFGVAVLAIALAYPVAYFLVFRAGRAAGLCLLLLLIPFWTSFLLRVMSWTRLLGSHGPVNWLLIASWSHRQANRCSPLQPQCISHHTYLRLDPLRGPAYYRSLATHRARVG